VDEAFRKIARDITLKLDQKVVATHFLRGATAQEVFLAPKESMCTKGHAPTSASPAPTVNDKTGCVTMSPSEVHHQQQLQQQQKQQQQQQLQQQRQTHEVALLESQSPVYAITRLQATRANRIEVSSTTSKSPSDAIIKVSPEMADAVEALRAAASSDVLFQVPATIEAALATCDAAQADLNRLNAELAGTSARVGAENAVSEMAGAGMVLCISSRDAARAAYVEAVAALQSHHVTPEFESTAAQALLVANQFSMHVSANLTTPSADQLADLGVHDDGAQDMHGALDVSATTAGEIADPLGPLPPEVRIVFDPESGKSVFVNDITKSTSWDDPRIQDSCKYTPERNGTEDADKGVHIGHEKEEKGEKKKKKSGVASVGPTPKIIASNVISQVDAWYNQAKHLQADAIERTEHAARALASKLTKLAAEALTSPSTSTCTAVATIGADCMALVAAVEAEAVALVASIDPSMFPDVGVGLAVRWLENAALEAVHRFETIHTIVSHHAATCSETSKWVDPASKQQLLESVKLARKSKNQATKELEEVLFKQRTAGLGDSDDDSDDAGEASDPAILAAAVRAAKVALATASKQNIRCQATLAAVIRDHFPELANHKSVTAKGSLFQLMGKFGGLAVYNSKEENYEIGDRIQTSGTHEVHRATGNLGDGKTSQVVLKRFRLDDARSRKMFERELRIMARLRHPNIVSLTGVVYNATVAEAYLEMPYFHRGDLRQHFAASIEHRAEAEVQQIFFELLKALEYLHSNGVTHLDVKPDNILIGNDGCAKLSDFDVSKDTSSRAHAIGTVAVTTMAITGLTMAYAPPEVLAHARGFVGGNSIGGGAAATAATGGAAIVRGSPVGPASDMWSAGCVLFFMVFYPLELSVDMSASPSDHIPPACSQELRALLAGTFSQQPHHRPTATEALLTSYLNVHSQRELAAKTAALSVEEHDLARRCTEGALHAHDLEVTRQEVIKERHAVCKQLQVLAAAQSDNVKQSAALQLQAAQLQKDQEAKAAELGQRAEQLRTDQVAAAVESANLHREQAKLTSLKSVVVPPAYWNARELNDSAPPQQIDVTSEMRDSIEWLMNKTAKPQFHGQGRDSHGLKFSKFKPVKVWRIENHQLWRAYVLRRDAIAAASSGGSVSPIAPAAETAVYELPSGARLDKNSNEHLLFHGTKVEAVSTLCNRGFDARIGALGGLFGAGCYFAENSSKSDEYVPPGSKQYMFLCRVVLGAPFVTQKTHANLRRPPCVQGHLDPQWPPCGHDRCDSLMATTKAMDPRSWLQKFREFVVYDHSQCYPEYLIEYERQ
jgi:serine/threonine protein kinase